MPTASPRISRKPMSISALPDIPEPMQPMMKSAAPMIKLFLRPMPRARNEAMMAPVAAPTIIELTTHSCSWLESPHS